MALMHVNFFSNALGMCVACDVILPQKTAPEHGFKTLWLLHGMSDNHTIWGRRTSVERYVDKYDLAVVMPNGHLSSYANMAHGGKYFTYIADELPKIMRGFFPLSARRAEKGQIERFGEEFRAETHQLEKIFEVIGTPPREDLLALDDGPMKDVGCGG